MHTARRHITAAILATALLGCSAVPVTAAAAEPEALELLAREQLTPRLEELTFRTAALDQDTHVRVLLPAGYEPGARRRYPVLYLLHGAIDDYRSWTDKGDAERLTAPFPLIVVMPDGGQAGFYSDWYNAGAGGPPMWETYHLRQLVPWVERNYRVVARRSGRAVAGLSMGGFGAFSYAARHPDMFVSAASFSGAVDTNQLGVDPGMLFGVTELQPSDSVWGPRQTEEVRWRGHNPWDLAENLRGLSLTLRTGNGEPGGPYGGGDPIEAWVHAQSASVHERLEELGIAHVWDDYGPGGHAWPYWQRDLDLTLPDIMAAFARPPAPPSPFDYTATEPEYEVHGWRVQFERPALEFSRLERADRSGFRLVGSGEATVTTGPLFEPRTRWVVTRSADVTERIAERADRRGRLSIAVPLGAGNPDQQYTPQAALTGTRTYSSTVTIEPRCAAPTGRLRGRRLGRARLGRARATVRRAFPNFDVPARGIDRFCLEGGGAIRVRYLVGRGARPLPRGQRRALAGKAVIALTDSTRYAAAGVRPGRRASRLNGRVRPLARVGGDAWYVLASRRSPRVVRVRGARVREVGVASRRLVQSRRAAMRMLRSLSSRKRP